MTTTDATYAREISYDRSSRDYAMYLDGELVGYARTYHEAEITLDELVFELLSSGATATATQLDGGSDVDECAAEVVGMLVEVAQDQPMTPATPRVLRINLLETRVRSTLADIDAWRAASGKQVHVRGLKCGPYARLYLSLDCEPFPGELIDLLLPSIRELQGSIASVGAWMIQLEVAPVLDEQALWQQCEVA